VIEPAIADQFGPYLRAHERVLWTGRPRQGLMLTSRDIFLIPFSAVWLGFVVFWELQVVGQHAGMFAILWGAGFFILGAVVMVGRFFFDARARARTLYALTGERALVLRWVRGVRLLSADLTARLNLKRSNATRGSLEFGDGEGFVSDRNVFSFTRRQDMSVWTPALSSRVQFIDIDDVMEAYAIARPNRPAP
jgi:hypothetical protein